MVRSRLLVINDAPPKQLDPVGTIHFLFTIMEKNVRVTNVYCIVLKGTGYLRLVLCEVQNVIQTLGEVA